MEKFENYFKNYLTNTVKGGIIRMAKKQQYKITKY
jgi:hypothetical protein